MTDDKRTYRTQKLSRALAGVINALDADQTKIFKAALVHDVFARAVRKEYGDTTAAFVLSHVQAVYVMRDDEHLKSAYAAHPDVLLRVYTDDSMVRSDLDARQESLKLKMIPMGVYFDKMKNYQSTFNMRKRKPYEDLIQELSGMATVNEVDGDTTAAKLEMTETEIDEVAALAQDPKLVDAIRRAMKANLK